MARAPAELKNEIATIQNDPNRWQFGDRIAADDSTLESRGQGKGLRLYDELARDGQVGAVLAKRRAALIARPWEVEPADDTPAAARAAELVTAQLKALGMEGLVEELLGALLKGVGIVEILWDATAEGIAPIAAKGRDPRRFAFVAATDAAGRIDHVLRLLTRAQPLDGEPVPERKFVVHRFGRRYDNPWGLGLGHQLFWPVFFKRKGVGFWLGALEKFGQPTGLGRYPAGTPEAEQKKLLAALQAIATDAGVAIPEGMTIELLEAKRSGTFESYRDLAQYMDAEISKIVLGETLTTAVGESGSRALGDVHNEVRLELTRADADQLSRTLNATLVRWIVELNLPSAPPPRLWWDVSEPEDLAALAARDEALVRIGYRPTAERVTDVYGEGYEAIAAPSPQPSPARAGEGVMRLFREAAPAPPRDAADVLTDQLGALLAEGDDPLLRALTALVERAASLEEVRDGLVALLPEVSDARLAELMAQALIVANLQGRADLADGV
jgi:phage gp29-like protein